MVICLPGHRYLPGVPGGAGIASCHTLLILQLIIAAWIWVELERLILIRHTEIVVPDYDQEQDANQSIPSLPKMIASHEIPGG